MRLKLTKSEFGKYPSFIFNNAIISLIFIFVLGIGIRIIYFVPDLPISLDAIMYFSYAIDTSILGHLPQTYSLDNNGWPIFLSFFFSMIDSDNPYSYMFLQRIVSLTISSLTIIPIFFLSKHFFKMPYPIIGASIFAFEPRLIQNSLLGITEPLFLFLLSVSVVLFLRGGKFTIVSFIVVGLATLVRAEGLFLFIALSVLFFIFNEKKFWVKRYFVAFMIFILILLPMSLYQNEIHGNDRIFSRVSSGIDAEINSVFLPIVKSLENFLKFFLWNTIPIFISFIPLGVFIIIKKWKKDFLKILIPIVGLSLPAFYAYSIPALDTRFLFPIFPFLIIVSIFPIQYFFDKKENRNTVFLFIIIGIIFASVVFLEYKKLDIEHEKEAFELGKIVADKTIRINLYPPESQYVPTSKLVNLEKFPVLISENRTQDCYLFNCDYTLVHHGVIIPNNLKSTKEIMNFLKENNITHLVIDDKKSEVEFLNNVYHNREKYPYLEKIYDSSEFGYNYHLKIFKINYKEFDS